MRREENTVPTNYVPLPAAPETPGPGSANTSHERLRAGAIHGSLTLHLTTLDPVRVGTGGLYPIRVGGKPVLAQDLVVRHGVPTIPGSGLKGMLRSAVEAMGGGCDLDRPCNPPCVACQLFGFIQSNRQYAGRIGLEDALPVKGKGPKLQCYTLPRAFQPRKMVGRRVYGPAVPGAPVSVPALGIAPGAVYETRLHVENLSPAEAGLIALGLGLDGTFTPRVGGARYHGFGRVRITATRARLRLDGYASSPTILEGPALDAELKRWLAAVQLSPAGQRALWVLRETMGAS